MQSDVFDNFKLFGNVVKHFLSVWYIFSIETKTKKKTENKTNEAMDVRFFSVFALVLTAVSIAKIFHTLKTVFDNISKPLEVRRK